MRTISVLILLKKIAFKCDNFGSYIFYFISKVSQKFQTLTCSCIFETAIGSLSFSTCIVSLFRALDSYNIRYGEVRGRGGGNFGGGIATPRVRR